MLGNDILNDSQFLEFNSLITFSGNFILFKFIEINVNNKENINRIFQHISQSIYQFHNFQITV